MVDLDVLTKNSLEKLAEECNISLKSGNKGPLIKQIENAKIPEEKLKNLIDKYPQTGRPSKKGKKKQKLQPSSTVSNLENRIAMLEKQVKFLMSKMDGVEVKLAQGESFAITSRTGYSSNIGAVIKAHVKPGESITIDKLIQLNDLQKFSLNSIEQAIIALIDNEVFDVSHGGSIQKIGGNIGRIIRR